MGNGWRDSGHGFAMTSTAASSVTSAGKVLNSASPLIVLVGIIVFGATLRIWEIGQHSLWSDEIASLQLACGRSLRNFDCPADQILRPGPDVTSSAEAAPLKQLWQALRQDTHPPLYLLTLRLWRALLGDGDVAARSLSMICSILAMLWLYDAARLLNGHRAALWAAAIMALATPQIEFAQETRSYAMLAMWTLAAMDALVRIEKLGATPRRTAALAATLLAAALTHYYGAAAIGATALYAAIQLRGEPRRSAALALCAAIAMFAIIGGPLLWAQGLNFHDNMTWIADSREGLWARTLQRIAILPLRYLISPMRGSAAIGSIAGIVLILPALLWRRKDLRLWWFFLMATLALPAAADLVNGSRSLDDVRYTLSGSACVYALIAVMLSDKRGWFAHILPLTAALSCAAALAQAYAQPWKPPWREFAASWDQQAGADDLLVLYQDRPGDWYQPQLHAGLTHYSRYPKRPLLVLSHAPDESLRKQIAAMPRAWIASGSNMPPIGRLLPGAKTARLIAMPGIGQLVEVRIDTGHHINEAPISRAEEPTTRP